MSTKEKYIFSDQKKKRTNSAAAAWKVLIVDDEADVHKITRYALSDVTFEHKLLTFLSAYSADEAKELLAKHRDIALILLDVVMERDQAGLELVKYIREDVGNRLVRIILRTGQPGVAPEKDMIATYDINDYKAKTELTSDKLFTAVIASLRAFRDISFIDAQKEDFGKENSRLKRSLLSGKLEHPDLFRSIITNDDGMYAIFQYMESISTSIRPVLIVGETGVGKELFATVLHRLSGSKGDLVAVNVAGLDDNVFSDTIFGHCKGAFTGATEAREGLISRATDGTLFLDEIGDLNLASQKKLLRLLQEREYYSVGSDTPRSSNARIIVATNSDLRLQVRSGEFRQDLYYRLSTHEIFVPPLRERKSDLPILTRHFLEQAAVELGIPVPTVPENLEAKLIEYDFPGNVRQLEGMIFDAVSHSSKREVDVDRLCQKMAEAQFRPRPRQEISSAEDCLVFSYVGGERPTLKELCNMAVDDALRIAEGNQAKAARILGLSRQALFRRLKNRPDPLE